MDDLILKHYEELYHHGVKGMKWGVRRYQNYDGSYTKKGLERFRKAESDYDSAKANSDKVKQAYKSGAATKQQYKSAKVELKTAKHKLNASYDKLKTDKMADEGKKLYQQGKTIGDNVQKNRWAQLGLFAGDVAASVILRGTLGDTPVANISSTAISAGTLAVGAIIAGKTNSENKKLRAYYAH